MSKHIYGRGDLVEIRYLPASQDWERATYVRRIEPDDMPPLWRGPRGHFVKLMRPGGDERVVSVTCQRIRQPQNGVK